MLTEREKWLMEQAYDFGACHRDIYFINWLNDMAADAVTVEMVLEKDAPATDHEATIQQAVAAEREACAKLTTDCDISPSQADSNGCLTNAQDNWVMGTYDASEQIADAIRQRGEK